MNPIRRAALCGLLLFPSLAAAGPLRADVLELLNGFEDSPSAEEFKALGGGVVDELMEIADDHSVASTRRSRALSALQHFPTPASKAFLIGHVEAADKGILRRKAAMALGAGFGAEAVPTLAKAIDDDDALVRTAVAQALGMVADPSAAAALQGRLEREDQPAVQEAIRKALEAK